MRSLQTAVGAVVSDTLTVAVQESTLPEASLRLRTTELLPMSEQLKELVLIVLLEMPQLSLDPPSTSAAVIEALPLPSRKTVRLLQTAVGGVTSLMVTVAEQEALLPEASVPVSVTVVVPILAQVKAVSLRTRLVIPQLSEEPPSTSAVVKVALPEPSRVRLTALQIMVGAFESSTVTVELQEAAELEYWVEVGVVVEREPRHVLQV